MKVAIQRAVRRAARRRRRAGADLVVAAEMAPPATTSAPGRGAGRTRRRTDRGEDVRVAGETGVAVVYGYPKPTAGRLQQRPAGRRDRAALANYRKTHLFGDLDRAYFAPGDEPVVQADLAGIRVGLLICYDVEFPEPLRRTRWPAPSCWSSRPP